MELINFSKKKGFMHSLEGTIAAVILLFYAVQLFQSMTVQRIDWVEASSKQEMQEFLITAKNSDMKELVFYGDFSTFIAATRHFLGESRGYSLKITNLPKQFFEAGVITDNIVDVDAALNTSNCLVPTEYSCYEATFQGIDYVLADYELGAPNGLEEYDALYFDFDSSGTYNSSEGPFIISNMVRLGGAYWTIGAIHNNSGNVSFWDAERLAEIRPHMNSFKINSRETNVSIRGAAFSKNLHEFDALIVPQDIDITPYEDTIHDYVMQGGGVVRLKNITAPADISDAEKNLLAISWLDYDVFGSSEDGVIANVSATEKIYLAKKYFIFPGISIDTFSADTTGYFTEGIPNNDTAHIGSINLGKQNYAVLVTKAAASTEYDLLRIDDDQDNNFTNEIALAVGDSIIIGANNYTVKEILFHGRQATIRMNKGHEFNGIMEPQGKVYPESGSEKHIFAKAKAKGYSVTARDIGAPVITPVSACIAGESTMPLGEHRCGKFYAGADYNFSITNTSTEYNRLNIDFDNNGKYNDDDEGPYRNMNFVTFGPEKYMATIDPDGAHVMWVLFERWPVPYGIANYIGDGTAIWMPDNQVSDDEWSLLEAALVGSGKSSFEKSKGMAQGMWVVSRSVFFENKETYQPYEVALKMWY